MKVVSQPGYTGSVSLDVYRLGGSIFTSSYDVYRGTELVCSGWIIGMELHCIVLHVWWLMYAYYLFEGCTH